MRKHLMAGTALAAATMLVAGGAVAADKKMMKPSISVNGYYDALVGAGLGDSRETKYSYTAMRTPTAADPPVQNDVTDGFGFSDGVMVPMKMDDEVDTPAVDQKTDAEIHFNGRATLDSGMKIHMRVELEAQEQGSRAVAGDWVDEYFLSVSGSFGQIILGGTGGAPVKMLTGLSGSWATGVGETLSFDSDDWVPSAAGNFGVLQHSRLDTGDGDKITYISPKLGGFQLGVSYVPTTGAENNSEIDTDTTVNNGLEGALSYSGKFGDVGFGAGFGMTQAQGGNDVSDADESAWLAAGRLDFGAIRLSAVHKQTTNEDKMDQGQLTDVGARFVSGANSFSLVGSYGEMKNNEAKYTAVMASYARALGPGVKWHANLIWNQSESAVTDGDTRGADGVVIETVAADTDYMQQKAQSENSGMALVTGLKVVF